MAEALEQLNKLVTRFAQGPPDQVQDAVAALVKAATLHFNRGETIGNGRRRTTLSHLDIAMRPEVRNVLGIE